jgi:hypothetical protein
VPVDGSLQTPLGTGFDQPIDGFLNLFLDVVYEGFLS